MKLERIIVVGASAGGFEAIKILVAGLPPDLPAAVLVVWHMSPDVPGIMPEVLDRIGTMPASHAVDGAEIVAGNIYVAPPDRHLVVEEGRLRTTRGPKENRFRPAIDPLFRSAALHYAEKVIGVILTGALDDGTSGLWSIKQRGGTAVVQDPSDAEVSSMPENAIRQVDVDHIVPLAEMPALLARIVADSQSVVRKADLDEFDEQLLEAQVGIALEHNPLELGIMEYGDLTPFTCPDCHGVLTRLREGENVHYRCHTGHAFSADTLLSSVTNNIETSLWDALRGIDESILLLNHMGDHFAEINQPRLAGTFFRKAREAADRNQLVRNAVMHHEQLSSSLLRQLSEDEIEVELEEKEAARVT